MNQEFNYMRPAWQGDCVPQPDTICNYYVLTDNDWFFFTFRRQAADLHRQLNLSVSALGKIPVSYDSGFVCPFYIHFSASLLN